MLKLLKWFTKNKNDSHFSEFIGNQSVKWMGNSYGGFYVDLSLLNQESIIVSAGIGEDISFDKDLFEIGVKQILMFDPTPKSKKFIDEQNLPNQFHFYEYGLSTDETEMTMFLPKNKNYISGSLLVNKNIDVNDVIKVKCVTISTICSMLGNKIMDLLKIDIEGSEYDVLDNMLNEKIFPKQICVEFHNRFFIDGEQRFNNILQKLIKNNYHIMGVSKSSEEFLFIHKPF